MTKLLVEQVQAWANAIGAKDLERVMSIYSPDLISFDLDPPLRCSGSSTKRRAWQKFFAAFPGAVTYEVSELSVTAGSDTAFAHSLNHVHGQRASGEVVDLWLRWTACFHRANAGWLIVHDHASVPADLAQSRALVDLAP